MTQHGAYSIIVYIRGGMRQQLDDLLQQVVKDGVETNDIVPFKKITTIHFARFVILDQCNDVKGNLIPARLVFTTNYDMPLNRHLQQMISVAGSGLWRIFSLCEGFPGGDYNAAALETFLQSRSSKAATFYAGVGYRGVQQIHDEQMLRDAINDFADRNSPSLKNLSATAARQQIIDFVHTAPGLEWAQTPSPPPTVAWKLSFYGKLFLAILLFLIFLPLIIPFV
ncbi:MAG TPA: hypothetical protein VIU45_09765, partial [Chitinophagaceae bacterium]